MSIRPLSYKNVTIDSGFWRERQDLVNDEVIPYQWKALNDAIPGAEPSHSIENFRIAAGLAKGEFKGFPFQDSDLAKWIEAASFSLGKKSDPELLALVEGAIDLIAAAQDDDGYINTYVRVAQGGRRWENLTWGHELYTGGHLIEAAVAHFEATGSRRFLDIMCRYADCVAASFGREEGKIRGYCGHPEVELALYKLYRATGVERYRELAEYFVDERGASPSYFAAEQEKRGSKLDRHLDLDYYQAHEPLRDQQSAEGHSVRAMYLYSAAADYCREKDDPRLRAALMALWDSVAQRRMYVTGGIGSHAFGERFSIDYDLPSDRAYAETCASIGLVMWAYRMLLIDPDARYANLLERALYNGVLSGISADGKRFFYVNPLESRPAEAHFRRDEDHVKTQRVQWFGCACCPPNVARTIASIGGYAYSYDEASIWVHCYIAGEARLPECGLSLEMRCDYPWDGLIRLEVQSGAAHRTIRLRVPDWSSKFSARLNGAAIASPRVERGYLVVERDWNAGDYIELDLDMSPRFLYARPEVADAAGMVALQRGPLVFCAEEVDNGSNLASYVVDASAAPAPERFAAKELGRSERLVLRAKRVAASKGELYGAAAPRYEDCELRLVPYFQWANRGEGEMRVWLRKA
jgi:Uncharacterized protein conserved in bacteria